jgi:Fe-S cluster biogenesis protein NfuA
MRENVEKALQKIRPALQADGGDIELIDVVDVPDDSKDGGGESPQAASSRGKER